MRLKLLHPGFRTCDDCQRYLYDPETGAMNEYPPGSGVPIARPPGSPTPCYTCPKVSGLKPEHRNATEGRRAELSKRNQKTFDLYEQVQGANLNGSNFDPITVHNLGIVGNLVRGFDRSINRNLLAAIDQLNTLLGKR